MSTSDLPASGGAPTTTASTAPADGSAAPSRSRRSAFRPDIEGLRAIAVLGVLIYHAGVTWLPGGFVGVDVFFVISGFLITGLIHAEMEREGRLSVTRFYARRIKRLLPVAALVLVLTAIGSALFLSSLHQVSAARDIQSAAVYVLNWRLAFQGTDYLAAAEVPGPVQHYWSLCVEEQFYLLWPFVMVGAGLVARRLRVPLRPLAGALLAVIGVLSFLRCVRTTSVAQPYAFFGTPSRVWELALGGVLALGTPYLVTAVPVHVRRGLAWVGLAAILVTFALLDASTPFPGTVAAIPVVGTGLVLLGGMVATTANAGTHRAPEAAGARARWSQGPVVLLGTKPMAWTGRISYSLYLWHWPLLVLGAAWLGHAFTPTQGLLVVAVAAVPSWLTWRYLEEPFRRSNFLSVSPRRAFVVAVVCMAAALAASLVPLLHGQHADRVTVQLAGGTAAQVSPLAASKDIPSITGNGCGFGQLGTELKHCTFGDPGAATHVVLLGDSHAIQWFPAVETMRRANGWYLDVIAKYSCPMVDLPLYNYELKRPYPECTAWRAKAMAELEARPPDVVLVTGRDENRVIRGGTALAARDSVAPMEAGLTRTLGRLVATGAKVVYIRDVPLAGVDMPACIAEHGDDLDRCSFDVASVSPLDHYEDRAVAAVPGVRMLDATRLACPTARCPVVSPAGAVTYRDPYHLSASYVQELAPAFAQASGLVPARTD